MKLDTALAAALADVPAAARAAEETGFDTLWTAETGHDPYLPCVLAAEHTKRIKLGTSIAVAFPRSPLIHAMTAWDLQALSGGRFVLGLGTQVKGHNERRFGVTWDSPGPRLREMILMIRAAWDTFQNGTRPSFEGKFYRFTLMTPFFNPGPIQHPKIPIYIAGVNEYICRLAGELCDGFHVHPLHSIKYVREFVQPNIAKGAAQAGRKTSDCVLTTSTFVIAGDTPEEQAGLRQLVRQQISFYASTPAYRPVLEAHGWGEVGPRLTEKSRVGDWSGMADLITDDMLEVFAVTGRWDDVPDLLRKRYDGLLASVSLYVPFRTAERERWQKLTSAIHS
ncbi:MAG: TIGR03617 family F420-dependent LLM class oxidoreductase [Deltaproteobacteria bacterium]|nr:TIGR03617 family F420-dependent LLM class oxidoreductase [Deltaproteobacteria bacterium]